MWGTHAHAHRALTHLHVCSKCLHVCTYNYHTITTNIWVPHTPIIRLSREQCRTSVHPVSARARTSSLPHSGEQGRGDTRAWLPATSWCLLSYYKNTEDQVLPALSGAGACAWQEDGRRTDWLFLAAVSAEAAELLASPRFSRPGAAPGPSPCPVRPAPVRAVQLSSSAAPLSSVNCRYILPASRWRRGRGGFRDGCRTGSDRSSAPITSPPQNRTDRTGARALRGCSD